ncbi:MAG: FkbM family methyltransferase [Calditrichaeota bacterium]|nr:FkbM family methyltransferase [Calditrichota bacterium]
MEKKKILKAPLNGSLWYEPELRLLPHIIPADKPFFDVGANQGLYGLMALDLVGKKNLFNFEPMPIPFLTLKYRFRRSNNHQTALSDKPGVKTIHIPLVGKKKTTTRATLEKGIIEQGQTGTKIVRVKTATLDLFAEKSEPDNIGFLKIDVEGHELKTISGGLKTIKTHKPIIQAEIEQRHHDRPIESIFEFIEHLGYRGYFFNVSKMTLLPISGFSVKKDQDIRKQKSAAYINNFIFIPKSQVSKVLDRAGRWLEKERKNLIKN